MADTTLNDVLGLDLSEYTTSPYAIKNEPAEKKQVMSVADVLRGTKIGSEWKTPSIDTLTAIRDRVPTVAEDLTWSIGTNTVRGIKNAIPALAVAAMTNPVSTGAGLVAGATGWTAGSALGASAISSLGIAGWWGKALGGLAGVVGGIAGGLGLAAGAGGLIASVTPTETATEEYDNPLNPAYQQRMLRELDDKHTKGEITDEEYTQNKEAYLTFVKNAQKTIEDAATNAKEKNDVVDMLDGREYPDGNIVDSVIAWGAKALKDDQDFYDYALEQRKMNPNGFANVFGGIVGNLVPYYASAYLYRAALTTPKLKTVFQGNRFRENIVEVPTNLSREQVTEKVGALAKAYTTAQMAGEYTAENVLKYIERTGDVNLENYQPTELEGAMAGAYGAIGAITEFELGGVEPLIVGSFKKVGLKLPTAKVIAKTGGQEAYEETVQNLTQFLSGKIDDTETRTWGEFFKDTLQAVGWALVTGGTIGAMTHRINRANLVKGIVKYGNGAISEQQATQVADAMIEMVEETMDYRKNDRLEKLKSYISAIYEGVDMPEAERADTINTIASLEYALISQWNTINGTDIADDPIFKGEVNALGWFRTGIPETQREAIDNYFAELAEAEKQQKNLEGWIKKAQEANNQELVKQLGQQLDEIESKLEVLRSDKYRLDLLGDLVAEDKRAIALELRKRKQQLKAKQKTKDQNVIKELDAAVADQKAGVGGVVTLDETQALPNGMIIVPGADFDINATYSASEPYKYQSNGNNFEYYIDGQHHVINLVDANGNTISSIEIHRTDNKVSNIQTFDEYKRKGFGTVLLKEAERLFGEGMLAKPSTSVEAQEFWKKNKYTKDMGKGLLGKDIELTEPTAEEEKEAVKQAEDVKDGTISTGTPESVAESTENILQDYGEKIEGAKKDLYEQGGKEAKVEKTTVEKIMKKAPANEQERKLLEDWLNKQDPAFVESIKELNLPLVVMKSDNYKEQLRSAYNLHPELKDEKPSFQVLYGWDELSPETLAKYNITPEYEYYFKTDKHSITELTPLNVLMYLGRRKEISFMYQKSTRGSLYLWGKKGVNGSWLPLIEFASAEEMKAHKESHSQEDLEKIYTDMTTYRDDREKVIRERVGVDYRNGKNVTEKEFADTFGFRGVQFGNYEKNEKRQKEVNNSYDSFLDLANILGLPPKAISLGGTLGIAFGARGSGKAAAHYEPDLKVINITRDAGAGALAHEWFHALDNYLAQNLSQYANMAAGGWITKSDNYYYYKVNEELSNALKEYIRAIKNEKAFQIRLRQLGQYWKRDWEVAARLFEQYVSAKVAEQNGINDYLADPQKYYITASPYLTLEESQRVFPKLENMLNSIKTREEEGTVILFQPGFASMRGELIGDALDADLFFGTGEKSSVWFWGNYLLADMDIDKENYFEQFNRSGPTLTYDGKPITDKLLSEFGITSPEVVNKLKYSTSIFDTKERVIEDLERVYKMFKDDYDKLVNAVRQHYAKTIGEDKFNKIIDDIEKIVSGKGATLGPAINFPEDSDEYKIQQKYKQNEQDWSDFVSVYVSLISQFEGKDYFQDPMDMNGYLNTLAYLHNFRKSLEKVNDLDWDKFAGQTGLSYQGKDIDIVLSKLQALNDIPPFEANFVKKRVRNKIKDALVHGQNVSQAIKELETFETKELIERLPAIKQEIKKGIERYKVHYPNADVKEVEKALLDFASGTNTVDLNTFKELQEKHNWYGENAGLADIVYFSKTDVSIGRDIIDVVYDIREAKAELKMIKAAEKEFNKQQDFVYKPMASMYEFDVPASSKMLSAGTKLYKQSPFVQDALLKFIGDYSPLIPGLRPFVNVGIKYLGGLRDFFEVGKLDGQFDIALLKDMQNNMMKSPFYQASTWHIETALDRLMATSIEDAVIGNLGKKATIQDVIDAIDVNVESHKPGMITSQARDFEYEDMKTMGKVLKDNLLRKYTPDTFLQDVASFIEEPTLSQDTGKGFYDILVRQLVMSPAVFDTIKQDTSLGLREKPTPPEMASKLLRKYGIAGGRYYGKRDKRGFVTFDRTPMVKRLFQNRVSGNAPATYRGAYIPALRFILKANRMDASSLSHELAHDWFEVYVSHAQSGKASKEFMRSWGVLEKALGIDLTKPGSLSKASEIFARAYEAWIMDKKDWAKNIAIADKDKEELDKLFKNYQNHLRDIYNNIVNPYFQITWGKVGELKPELRDWFDRMTEIKSLEGMVERGEITQEQANQERINQAIDTVIANTEDADTKRALQNAKVLNDTSRYEAEGGNKNSLQRRIATLAKAIDENNMLIKENYDTHRDMLEVAKQADNFVRTRLDDALAIINGQMAEQEGLFKEDIYTALERLALENGDLNLLDELKNSEIANRLAKELGQRVAGFRNWTAGEIDVVSTIKTLDNKFNQALKNKKAQAQMKEATELFESAQKEQDKLADKQLESTLKELECK